MVNALYRQMHHYKYTSFVNINKLTKVWIAKTNTLYYICKWLLKRETMSSYLTGLANNKKYTTAIVHTTKSNWNLETIDVSKITRMEVLDNGKYVTCRLVVKEPSNADSISTILGMSGVKLKLCSKWNLRLNGKICIWLEIAYKSKYYANIWDP